MSTPPAARTLPDRVRPPVRALFVGINPGLRSAALGHHFAGYSNRFWRLLFDSGLVAKPVSWSDDALLPDWGFGMTNLVPRATRGIDTLSPDEYAAGVRTLTRKIERWKPEVVVCVGVTVFRALCGWQGAVRLGLQPQLVAGAGVFVVPNPSGRNAHHSPRQMLRAFVALRRYLALPRGRTRT